MKNEDNPLIQALKNKSKTMAGPEDLLKFVLENFNLVPKDGPPEEAETPAAPGNVVTTQESHSA